MKATGTFTKRKLKKVEDQIYGSVWSNGAWICAILPSHHRCPASPAAPASCCSWPESQHLLASTLLPPPFSSSLFDLSPTTPKRKSTKKGKMLNEPTWFLVQTLIQKYKIAQNLERQLIGAWSSLYFSGLPFCLRIENLYFLFGVLSEATAQALCILGDLGLTLCDIIIADSAVEVWLFKSGRSSLDGVSTLSPSRWRVLSIVKQGPELSLWQPLWWW